MKDVTFGRENATLGRSRAEVEADKESVSHARMSRANRFAVLSRPKETCWTSLDDPEPLAVEC
jgi:hypothetical protein